MQDLIDREFAIRLFMGEPPELHYPAWYADLLRSVPSAIYPKEQTGDLISREAVLERYRVADPRGTFVYCDNILEFIKSLPSAQPERGQAEKRCPVGGVDRSGEVDRITIEAANETPFWLGIFETEPERLVDVRMSYSDLKCLLDCFDHVRKFLKERQGADEPQV